MMDPFKNDSFKRIYSPEMERRAERLLCKAGYELIPITCPTKTRSFLKCEGGSVEKDKIYNHIELYETNLSDKIAFAHSFFFCKNFPSTKPSPIGVRINVSFDFLVYDTCKDAWFRVNTNPGNCIEITNNPFKSSDHQRGRKRIDNPYLSLIFKIKRSDLHYKKGSIKTLSSISIVLSVTLQNERNEEFTDFIDIPFRLKKTIPMLKPIEIPEERPYMFSSIYPSEGVKGDVVCFKGLFPEKCEIVFGIHKLKPALYSQTFLQCVVPEGSPGQSVCVLVIDENNNPISNSFMTFKFKESMTNEPSLKKRKLNNV